MDGSPIWNICPEIWGPKHNLSVTGTFLTCCLVDMRMFLVAKSLWTKRFFSRYIIPHAIWAAHSLRSFWKISDWWSSKRSSSAPIWTNSWTWKTTKYVHFRAIIKQGQVFFLISFCFEMFCVVSMDYFKDSNRILNFWLFFYTAQR